MGPLRPAENLYPAFWPFLPTLVEPQTHRSNPSIAEGPNGDERDSKLSRLRAQQLALLALAKHPAIHDGDLLEAVRIITEAAASTLGVERSSIWFFSPDRSSIVLQGLFDRQDGHSAGTVLLASDYPAYFRALETEELAIDASDAHRDPRTREFSSSYLTPLGIGAMLDAPIRLKGGVIGVLCNEEKGGARAWTVEEQQFAGSLATMLTLSMEARERREAERTMRLQTAATEGALDGMAILSSAGEYVYVNSAHVRLFGYADASELLGKSWKGLFEPADVERIEKEAFGLQKSAWRWRGEAIGRRRDGSTFPQEMALRVLDDGSILSVVRDITQRKKIERELRQAKDAAEAASQAKGHFLANMSHEIRTPMNGILGMVELALHTQLTQDQRGYLLTIQESAEALLSIINDILDFSKIEAGKVVVQSVEFNLRNLVDGVVEMFQPPARQKGLRLDRAVEPDVPDAIVGDSGRLRQILVNLVGNALKFTDSGEVRVQVRRSGEPPPAPQPPGRASGRPHASPGTHPRTPLVFSIRDTGPGIPREKHDAIFEEFTQLDPTSTRRHQGTGLGLAICKMLAEKMGGRIWVESELGRGSTFHVTSSFGLASVSASRGDAACREKKAAAQRPSRPLRILVAEDNKVNQKVISRLLEARGHQVTIAGNGLDAVEAVRATAYDLILMDVQMPGLDGLEATRRIRSLETSRGAESGRKTGGARVIALTAHATREDEERCLAAGMDGYLSKPVLPEKLYEVLRDTAGEAPATPLP